LVCNPRRATPVYVNIKSPSKKNDRLFIDANAAWDRDDLRRAFELFMQAARSGDASSQLNIGYFFDRGLHVKKDKEKALYWYHQAYRLGDPSAATNIATVQRELRRFGKMLWWFKKAIAMGDHDVLLDLGACYEKGIGLAKNLRQAKNCYRRLLAGKNVTEFSMEQGKKRLAKLQRKERNSAKP